MPAKNAQSGFTLVEVAVVLAIIGLLVGAILGAQSYIRSSQITTTINQGRFYLSAVKQFETIYGGTMPGDMTNATSVWSNAAGNGDGNGKIDGSTSGYQETFLAFDHLKLAGLITGSFTGLPGASGTSDGRYGINLPTLALPKVTGWLQTLSNSGNYIDNSDSFLFPGYYGVAFRLGRNTAGNNMPTTPFLSPEEAFNLDSKFDNGIPSTGTIRGYKNATACVISATAYVVSSEPDLCRLILTN